jgi:hypothetical protein
MYTWYDISYVFWGFCLFVFVSFDFLSLAAMWSRVPPEEEKRWGLHKRGVARPGNNEKGQDIWFCRLLLLPLFLFFDGNE